MTNTETKMIRVHRDAERQLYFCSMLMESLKRNWNMNSCYTTLYHQPIVNRTQIQADAKRLRRELMLFIKILDERG